MTFINFILQANNKHHISKGEMYTHQFKLKDTTRTKNRLNPTLSEMSFKIQTKHLKGTSKQTMGSQTKHYEPYMSKAMKYISKQHNIQQQNRHITKAFNT